MKQMYKCGGVPKNSQVTLPTGIPGHLVPKRTPPPVVTKMSMPSAKVIPGAPTAAPSGVPQRQGHRTGGNSANS